MKQVLTPGAASGLQRQLGLVGATVLQLDEIVVPISDVGDFAGSSPWDAYRRRGMDAQTSLAAGAMTNSFYLVQPGQGTILVVEQLYVPVAASGFFPVKIMRPADVAAVTVTATSAIAETVGRLVPSTGFFPQLAATASIGNHTTATVGAEIAHIRGLSNTTEYLPLKRGIVLDGTDPAGLPGLAVFNFAANSNVSAGVVVTEYAVVRPTP